MATTLSNYIHTIVRYAITHPCLRFNDSLVGCWDFDESLHITQTGFHQSPMHQFKFNRLILRDHWSLSAGGEVCDLVDKKCNKRGFHLVCHSRSIYLSPCVTGVGLGAVEMSAVSCLQQCDD